MKTEFLQNLKVGDQPLTKEVIDAILAENGRDVEAAKNAHADYDHIKEQLKTAQDALKNFEGVDVAQLQGQITTLNGQLAEKDKEWQAKLDAQTFDSKIKDAITAAKGKNHKAVAALLDLDALRASKNQDADIKAQLDKVKQENAWAFDDGSTPPPYAGGTGGSNPNPTEFSKMTYTQRVAYMAEHPNEKFD